ncbi:MAG: LLM class flavin-dependent oxidoreductase [Deltaproteobacteria bacterium]|nr:LLM class flavin-dependent oxidoreductase [Deltaproteobacteria bacterium]
MGFSGELGLQFTLQVASHYTTTELADLAGMAARSGFDQVWLSDALRYRNVLVVAAAIASKAPLKIGTAILVPYFRNPVDVAGALLALSELTGGREISLGIAKGSKGQVPQYVHMSKPFRVVRESVGFWQRLLGGEEVKFSDYPALCAYFQLNEDGHIRLAALPKSPVLFYGGGVGPRFLKIAGEIMDGVLIGGYFITMLRLGRLEQALAGAEQAARAANPKKKLRKVCELNLAVASDGERAVAEAKKYTAHHMVSLQALGYTPEEFGRLGIDYAQVDRLREGLHAGMTIEEAARDLVTDAMARACFVAGSPGQCVEPVLELAGQAQRLGFDQISFAKLGPDYAETIRFLSAEILPKLR